MPREVADLSALRGVGSTGAPLPAEGFTWVYETVGTDLQLQSLSGGTDVCTGFVGGVPLLPVHAGEITCRALGARVEARSADGTPVLGELGELVITAPMPSMPVGFWNDTDGSRYREAYFELYPGVWRHGDWITINERGGCVITGRSDATLNRGGVGRYVDGLLGALGKVCGQGIDLAVVGLRTDLERYSRMLPGAEIVAAPAAVAHRPARLAWEQTGLPLLAQQVGAQVLHSPFYTCALRAGCPVTVTVLDATFFTEP
ncbi:AMP-binding protein, partial [Micromonospora sp. DH15]|nr:AMP-binding protein [Micromonospora sp. DH15]